MTGEVDTLASFDSIYRKMTKLKAIIDVLAEQISQKFPQAPHTDSEQA